MSHEQFLGRSEERSDTAQRALLSAISATLDCPEPEGDELPPLWHWMLFQAWAPARALGVDGHPARGAFLPDDPAFPRRMWAGGRIQFGRAIRIGQPLRRRSRVTHVQEKQGSTGRSLWVAIEHVLSDASGELLCEQQDLVYRGLHGKSPVLEQAADPQDWPVSETQKLDAVWLFRYSALTANAHRIHYDQAYAREQEGYSSLVVQGALQATLLAALAQRQAPGVRLREFTFRARRPALLEHGPLALEARAAKGLLELRSRDARKTVCMTAEAQFEG